MKLTACSQESMELLRLTRVMNDKKVNSWARENACQEYLKKMNEKVNNWARENARKNTLKK